jgi:hypothetical protein
MPPPTKSSPLPQYVLMTAEFRDVYACVIQACLTNRGRKAMNARPVVVKIGTRYGSYCGSGAPMKRDEFSVGQPT